MYRRCPIVKNKTKKTNEARRGRTRIKKRNDNKTSTTKHNGRGGQRICRGFWRDRNGTLAELQISSYPTYLAHSANGSAIDIVFPLGGGERTSDRGGGTPVRDLLLSEHENEPTVITGRARQNRSRDICVPYATNTRGPPDGC